MQIVIELSDETYKDIKEENSIYGTNNGLSARITGKVVGAIQNGAPLPKGHGDLIDRKNLLQLESMWYHLRNGDVACPKIDIDHAPTIIEADRK